MAGKLGPGASDMLGDGDTAGDGALLFFFFFVGDGAGDFTATKTSMASNSRLPEDSGGFTIGSWKLNCTLA